MVYLLLGSNEGQAFEQLQQARVLIQKQMGTLIKCSELYRSTAWGPIPQADYLNQVVAIQSLLSAYELLAAIHDIEQVLGRKRIQKWGSRTIDIDILMINQTVIQDPPRLIVPHPYLHQRRFTLIPLEEIAPQLMHPILNKSIAALLAACTDEGLVEKISSVE